MTIFLPPSKRPIMHVVRDRRPIQTHQTTKAWNIAQPMWTQKTKPSSLGDSSPGGYLTSQQDHSGHIFLTEIITLKCPITHSTIPQFSPLIKLHSLLWAPTTVSMSKFHCLTTSIFIERWLLVIWKPALSKFRLKQSPSFPKAKTSIAQREARTTYSTGQIDNETNSVKIDWRVAWKRLAWDLWREEGTSQREKLKDKRKWWGIRRILIF